MIKLISLLNDNSRGTRLMKKVFHHFIYNRQATIPEVAAAVGCSVPAATKHVVELSRSGYIIDFGKAENREGRPANKYGIVPDSCFFVGVVIHYYSFNIGIMNLSGEIIKSSIDKSFRLSNSNESLDNIIDKTKAFITSVCVDNDKISKDNILNINFGISGRVNPNSGYSFSIFNTGETPLNQILTSRLKLNVTIDNDTRAMTYGEYADQIQNHSIRNMLCLNIGHGIGMGMVINGEVYGGKSGYAGELGHLSIFDNEVMCHCGKKGCLESETSGQYIINELYSRTSNGAISVLNSKIAEERRITVFDFIDAIVKREDPLCIEILEEIGIKLGRQIANMINLFNPDMIVITGLLSLTEDYILNPIKMGVKKHALTLVSRDTEIVISNLKMKSSIVGSCLMARDKILNY